jgi:hypothetical protein
VVARHRDDRRGLRHLAHRERDVGVQEVVRARDDERRPVRAQPPVGVGVVGRADRHAHARVVQLERAVHVRLEHDVRPVVQAEPAEERHGDRVVAREDDVSLLVRRQLARRTQLPRGLHPRRVEELDERERQQDQQEDDAREHHHDRERSPRVVLERDVAEAQRRHHRQRPVEARQPRVLLPLGRHQQMEDHAERGDHHHEQQDEPQQRLHVLPRAAVLREGGELGGQEPHPLGLGEAAEDASGHGGPATSAAEVDQPSRPSRPDPLLGTHPRTPGEQRPGRGGGHPLVRPMPSRRARRRALSGRGRAGGKM